MQYQAVVDRDKVIFIDSHGGYAHQSGEGGRLIRIAWDLTPGAARESLSDPVPFQVIHYFSGLREIQWRFVGELRGALPQALDRGRDVSPPRRRFLQLRPAV